MASIFDPAGGGDVITSGTAGSPKHFTRTSPALTALPGGRFVMAWVEKSADTFSTVPTVTAQLYSDAQLNIGTPVQVSSGNPKNCFHLSAAAVFANGSQERVFLTWAHMTADGKTSIRGSVLTAGPGGLS
ncbi:hypothetical protein GA0115233_101652 [Streptomyces sp. DI166]|nr:hypothetical protein GA0115233_101652 [Streptomyces sp. DI166]